MKIASRIFFALQIIAELVLAFAIWRTGMLSGKLWIAVGAIFAALALITGILAFPRGTATRIVSIVLALLVTAGSAYGSWAAIKAVKALDTITSNEAETPVGIYVRSDSMFATLEDAAGQGFATGIYKMGSCVQQTLDAVSVDTQKEINVTQYLTTIDAAQALLSGETSVLVMETGFVDILSDIEGFENFSDNIRLLKEYSFTDKTVVEEPKETEPPAEVTEEPFVIYVSGSDTRSGVLTTSRSDVNILLAVNTNTGEIVMVNTPRDYFVPISVSGFTCSDKLTHCGIYGTECSMETLGKLYDVDVDYYVQLNFSGFKTLIDAIGGIDIYSDYAFTTSPDPAYIAQGNNHLDGYSALCFVRERHALAGGDNARGENQMKMIKALISKLTDAPTILTSYGDILDSLSGMLATNLTSQQIADLVKLQIDNNIHWSMESYAVKGTGGSSTTYSVPSAAAYVTYPDYATVDEASQLLHRVLENK